MWAKQVPQVAVRSPASPSWLQSRSQSEKMIKSPAQSQYRVELCTPEKGRYDLFHSSKTSMDSPVSRVQSPANGNVSFSSEPPSLRSHRSLEIPRVGRNPTVISPKPTSGNAIIPLNMEDQQCPSSTNTTFTNEGHHGCCNRQSNFPVDLVLRIWEELQRTKFELNETKGLLSRTIGEQKTLETIQNQQSSEILFLKGSLTHQMDDLQADVMLLKDQVMPHVVDTLDSQTLQISSINEALQRSSFQQRQLDTQVQNVLFDLDGTKEAMDVQAQLVQDTSDEMNQLRHDLTEAISTLRRTMTAHDNTRNIVSEYQALLLQTQYDLADQKKEIKVQLLQLKEDSQSKSTWIEDLKGFKSDLQEVSQAVTMARITGTNNRKLISNYTATLEKTQREVADLQRKLDVFRKQAKDKWAGADAFEVEVAAFKEDSIKRVDAFSQCQETTQAKITNQDERLNRLTIRYHQIESDLQNYIDPSSSSHLLKNEIKELKERVEKIDSVYQIAVEEFLATKCNLKTAVHQLQENCDHHQYETERNFLDVKSDLSVFKTNLIPKGFLYTQYSGQEEPKVIWPSFLWQEVTTDYAGLFFRALGGNSRTFDKVQPEGLPRIGTVTFGPCGGSNNNKEPLTSVHIPQVRGVSHALMVPGCLHGSGGGGGEKSDSHKYGYQFHVDGSEVRPRNQAIRIWKRC